jgi:2-amino-4-hydroxy-6-hydroxymethyldihydropteridine diphosphokinase
VTETAHVGLGANLGDPARCVRWAIEQLGRLGPLRASSLYRSEPLGSPGQPWFVNAVVALETGLDAPTLLERLLELEREAGRPAERERWAPRVLDLDLLLFGDLLLESPTLTVPHPGLAQRRFVLEPLAELSPDLVHPRNQKRILDLLGALDDPLRVQKLPPTL